MGLEEMGALLQKPVPLCQGLGEPLVLPPSALSCRYKHLAASLPREMRRHTSCPSRLRLERLLSIGLEQQWRGPIGLEAGRGE